MQSSFPVETDIVLLGAGHAHVEVLRRFAVKPEAGVRLTLIGRDPETLYSGMLPGLIRGDYTAEQAHIDLAPLAAMAQARLILGEATGFDPQARTVSVRGRPDVPFDILSVDVGGVPAMPGNAGIGVKPIGRFLEQLYRLESIAPDGARIAVIGSGAGGVELVLALAQRFARRLRLTLVSATADPVQAAPASVRRILRQALVEAGVEVIFGVTAVGLQDGRLSLSDGSFIDADTALWATGIVGAPFLAASGLACDAAGCIRVAATLASVSHAHIFAVGDCAAIEGASLPKSAKGAVRAGAVLAENLRRAVRRRPLKPWRPLKHPLVMLGMGHGRAVGWWNGVAVEGRTVWRVKDLLDRRWMRMYSDMRMVPDPADPMRSGGSSIGAEVLAHALASQATDRGTDLLDQFDDTSVLRPPAGKLLVQSVDQFRIFLDDPYVFGQITAAHALSDIYAMGAEPWTALAIASVPPAPAPKLRADLAAMLQGAAEVLRAEGCSLAGGHTSEAAEAALGFAVSGLVAPGALLRRSGLRPGDYLILSKRLGTGIILAAHARGLARAAWLQAATASMRQTNAEAARILRGFSPRAATDVAGLGLAGHLKEMLTASGVAATLWSDAIPALPGAQALAARGVESPSAEANRRRIGTSLKTDLLADPQISGGLLVGVPPQRVEACVQALRAAGLEAAAIGLVEAMQPGEPVIRLG